jgi:two-component system osmolarity sensor histidine kinase EnvZ
MIGKRYLPKSLFGRALLILVLPTVLIQLVVAYVFFDRHWDNVSRHMSRALAGEAAFLVKQLRQMPTPAESRIITDFEAATGIKVFLDDADAFKPRRRSGDFTEFQQILRAKIDEPFTVRTITGGDDLEIAIALPGQTLRLETTVKRLQSGTTTIFILWMLGASAVFLLIAIVFMRNQIRPIGRLAKAAENFGRGVDTPGFRPHGASEVRQAARAFVVMRERISRQLRTRAEMLAGISHDLRTPLTRMKLQLAMMGSDEAIRELSADVQQMEHMIAEYLDFARGEGGEEAVKTRLGELLSDVVADYDRLGSPVTLMMERDVELDLRISAFRRMLHNLIDNALRYGKRCEVALRVAVNYCEIVIDDAGPGIPEDKREEVFRPFSRLDLSRNLKTGGVGLGLTIARDIVLAHGGAISLAQAQIGGLRVIIRLPI